MNTLKDYVEWKLTHSDKTAEVEGYPLILKKCKKNKKMKELKVYGNCVQDGTPTPENPIEIQSIGEKTKNLYDAKTYPLDKKDMCIWSSNGGIGMSTGFISTANYVPCVELRGKTITISGCSKSLTNPGIAFYDENQTYISGKGYTYQSYITCIVPDNASYYRFCVSSDFADTAMVSESDVILDYEPYGYKVPIVQRGKNLHSMLDEYLSWSGARKLETYDNGYLFKGNISSATDQYMASAGWVSFNDKLVQKFPIINGKPITISVDVTPIEKHDETRETATKFYCTVKKDTTITKELISPVFPLEIGVKSHLSYTFTPANYEGDALKVIVYLCSHTMKIENLQVEYGSTDTPYEPYIKPITHNVYLGEPLRKVGNSVDYIDFKTQKVMRKIGAKIFDGTENWTYEKLSYGNNFYTSISNSVNEHSSAVYSNMGSYYTNGSLANAYAVRISTSGNLNYRYQDYDNLTDFKNKLAEMYANGEPFYIVYRLKSETKEDISCQLPKLTTKTTIFETDTEIKPSKIYGKYIK